MKFGFIVAAAVLASSTALGHAQDVAEGEKVFKKCVACHAVGENARNKVGPALNGIAGAPIAEVEGFKYSKALEEKAGETWTDELMAAWLANPRDFAKGTKMAFAGLKKDDEIANVIAYLKTFD
ncbi:MAG TPA: cytochrome c family protein [Methylomirabilota bacterium]|nr:cytochrome c family protein [Methylomirabilota bacterium]